MELRGPVVSMEPIAKEDLAVLENLVELYAHDFSEHVPLELKPTGRFDISIGNRWWMEGHYPFFIRCNEKLCGFALVRRGSSWGSSPEVMDVVEFFVVRGARGKGIGASAARALFAAFPGGWEIRVRPSNAAALKFWSRAVKQWIGRPAPSTQISFEGVAWNLLRIEAQAPGLRLQQ